MSDDPRAENCRAFHKDFDGKVDGVELTVVAVPGSTYALRSVALIDEAAAQGNTTAACFVLDKDGLPVGGERVWLAWPWAGGNDTSFPERGLPGNSNYPATHVITNGYWPPERGPLAIYVGDAVGVVRSDVVCGLGLPLNRHVCYQMVFQERVAEAPENELLPEHEPIMAVGLLADKCRWWLEELARSYEQGNWQRGDRILYSLIKLDGIGLFYRLENALKQGQATG